MTDKSHFIVKNMPNALQEEIDNIVNKIAKILTRGLSRIQSRPTRTECNRPNACNTTTAQTDLFWSLCCDDAGKLQEGHTILTSTTNKSHLNRSKTLLNIMHSLYILQGLNKKSVGGKNLKFGPFLSQISKYQLMTSQRTEA